MQSNNILTVEEFLEKENLPECISGGTLKHAMIEFAKLHVEAALQAASKSVKYNRPYIEVKDSILNSYPLNNIK